MKAAVSREEDRTKALATSIILHAILLALLFFIHFNRESPLTEAPPILIEFGGGGDNAAAGQPDEGQGNDPAPPGQQMEDPSVTEPVEEPSSEPAPPTESAPPAPSKPETPRNTPTSTDPDAAALKKAQEETRRKQQQEQDRIRKEQEATRAAEAERQRQIAEQQRREQEERDKKKGQFGSTFGKPGSTGTGQGNTGKPGNQGIPGGTGDNPFGKTPGSGGGSGGGDGGGVGESIGDGLGGRRVVGRPSMVDDTQKTGKVAIRVCVNSDGRVTSANYTQRGSTTTDSVLRSKAESWARGYRFAPSDAAEQCGTITFDFRVK